MVNTGGFDEVENIQWICRRYLNPEIRKHFSDLDDQDWEADVGSIRGRMRASLTHKDGDSLKTTNTRLMMYYFVYERARQLQPETFSIPITSFDQQRRHKPKVTLKSNNRPYQMKNYGYVDGKISFRLMDKSATTIVQADLNAYATRIKNTFALPIPFTWHKGRKLISYSDWDKGYQLQLLVPSEAEARRIVSAVLDIQNHTPDWSRLNTISNSEETEAYPANPGTHTILGQVREKPKRRPVAEVRFQYATIALQGYGRGITLVDASSSRPNPLERV